MSGYALFQFARRRIENCNGVQHIKVVLGLLTGFSLATLISATPVYAEGDAAGDEAANESTAQLNFQPCWLTGSGGNGNLHAECATWTQPLDRAAPEGEQIELFVTRLKSTALEPAKDAFTLINGGPGASSVDMLVAFSAIASSFTRERDVIVIDQRGTGRSAPMSCDAVTEGVEDISDEEALALTQSCLDQLPHDPRFFTTTQAVEDLDALRAAMGYEQLSLYGVSYGTRVVMQYMRQYPDNTRSAVIDGVVPPPQPLGTEISVHSQETLDAIFDRCAEESACTEAFGDVKGALQAVAERLKEAPIPMTLPHPVTGIATELELSYPHLMIWLRLSLYAPETTALIPLILNEAHRNNNFTPIAANALRMVHDLTESLNYGMHNSVVCTEDTPFYGDFDIDFVAMEASYMGRQMYDAMLSMCSIWPQGESEDNIKLPLNSDIPTLVLSGEFDPITPPEWGDAVMPGLSNAKHLIAPGQGHGTLPRGCIPRVVLEFVESADISEVDDTCLQHLDAHPFFVNLMGPPP